MSRFDVAPELDQEMTARLLTIWACGFASGFASAIRGPMEPGDDSPVVEQAAVHMARRLLRSIMEDPLGRAAISEVVSRLWADPDAEVYEGIHVDVRPPETKWSPREGGDPR